MRLYDGKQYDSKQYMNTCFTWHWTCVKQIGAPFYHVYKTSSLEFKRHGQSILPTLSFFLYLYKYVERCMNAVKIIDHVHDLYTLLKYQYADDGGLHLC